MNNQSDPCMQNFLFLYNEKSKYFFHKLDVIDKKKTTAGNAKLFREKYNIIASRIACQILIKENRSQYFTHINCGKNVMIESK